MIIRLIGLNELGLVNKCGAIPFVQINIFQCLQSMSLLSANLFDSIPFLRRDDTQFTVTAPWVKVSNFSGQIGSSRDPISTASIQTLR